MLSIVRKIISEHNEVLTLIVLYRINHKTHQRKNPVMMSFSKLKELNMMSLLESTNNYRMIRINKITSAS